MSGASARAADPALDQPPRPFAGGFTSAIGRLAARDWFFWPAAAVVVLLGAAVELRARMTPDVAWYLYAARRVLDGKRLYVDVIEINPPLSMWLHLPIVAASRALGVPDPVVFRLCVFVLVLASAAIAAWLLRGPLAVERATRRWWLLALIFVLLPLTREDFGQREHVLLCVLVPYVLACAARAGGRAIPAGAAVALGAVAGVGMSLKPHFALAWLGLEAWLWLAPDAAAGARPTWRRPEALAAATVPVLYGAAVPLVTPQYLDMLRLVAGTYASYLSNNPLDIVIREPGVWLALFGLFAFAGLQHASSGSARAISRALAIATGALLVAALLQRKGWRYHLYPSFGCALLLLVTLLGGWRVRARSLGERAYGLAAAAVLVGIALSVGAAATRQALHPRDRRYEPYPEFPELLALVRDRARGGRVVIFSNNVRASFPLMNYAPEVGWASRFNALWIFGSVYAGFLTRPDPVPYRSRSAMGAAERYELDAIAEDLALYRPRLVIAQRAEPGNMRNPIRRLDYMGYLRRDPRIASFLSRYRRLPDVGDYEVYESAPDALAGDGTHAMRARPPRSP